MNQETIRKYNQEKIRISKISDTFEGTLKLLKLYQEKYNEKADHVITAINQFAKVATFGKAII